MDPNIDSPKRPDMVMCGDHPSFAKTELNAKAPDEGKEAPATPPRPTLSSTSVRTERPQQAQRLRASGHSLRARRHERGVGDLAHSPALVQGTSGATTLHLKAALGSFRWPPYLVAVWVVVLVLTHALHCFVGCLERALPRLRNLCQYLRASTERSWQGAAGARVSPAALAALTCAAYAVYCALYVLHALARWAVEPLADDRSSDSTARVTDYDDATRSDDSFK